MKKILVLLTILCYCVSMSSQVMRAEELEEYAKERYGDSWVEAAETLSSQLVLDKNNSLTYTQIVDCGEATKEQLYVILNYWFTATFNDANSVIKLNDKELGTIIGEGFVDGIAEHVGGMSRYKVSITPIIKVIGGGIISAFSDGTQRPQTNIEKWAIDTCYPFVEKDKHKAKKTSSKALVMAHAYSNVIMDKIEEVVKNGLVGNENDDW